MTSSDLRAVCDFSVEWNSIHLWKRNSFTYMCVTQQQQSSEVMDFGSSSGNVLFTERFYCLSSEHRNSVAYQACIHRVICVTLSLVINDAFYTQCMFCKYVPRTYSCVLQLGNFSHSIFTDIPSAIN